MLPCSTSLKGLAGCSLLRCVFVALLMASLVCGQSSLAIVEKKAGKVGFYTFDGRRTGEVAVGAHPHEMVFSADHRLLYVTDNGMLWMTDKGAGGNTISIVDVHSRRKAGVIDLGNSRRPHGIALLPQTGELVVTIENPYGLLSINPVTRTVIRKYDSGGDSPHMVVLGPGGRTAWVSNSGSGTVAVIDLASGRIEAVIPTGKNPQGGALSADGKRVYITNMESNSISMIDPETRRIEGEIRTGTGPARVLLTPDGKTLVYNLQTGQAMGFADVATRKEIAQIPLPGQPLSVSLSRDGKNAFLGIQDSDKVVIVSVANRKIVRVFDTPAGAGPDTVEPLDD
jgi:YVTN family beta-propeller protein